MRGEGYLQKKLKREIFLLLFSWSKKNHSTNKQGHSISVEWSHVCVFFFSYITFLSVSFVGLLCSPTFLFTMYFTVWQCCESEWSVHLCLTTVLTCVSPIWYVFQQRTFFNCTYCQIKTAKMAKIFVVFTKNIPAV